MVVPGSVGRVSWALHGPLGLEGSPMGHDFCVLSTPLIPWSQYQFCFYGAFRKKMPKKGATDSEWLQQCLQNNIPGVDCGCGIVCGSVRRPWSYLWSLPPLPWGILCCFLAQTCASSLPLSRAFLANLHEFHPRAQERRQLDGEVMLGLRLGPDWPMPPSAHVPLHIAQLGCWERVVVGGVWAWGY